MPGWDPHLDGVDDRSAVAASVGTGQRDDNGGEQQDLVLIILLSYYFCFYHSSFLTKTLR